MSNTAILGMKVGQAESEEFWVELPRDMLGRGLEEVRLGTSDAHEGLKRSIAKCPSCSWQRCRARLMRNVFARLPKRQKNLVAKTRGTVFAQYSVENATQQWRQAA